MKDTQSPYTLLETWLAGAGDIRSVRAAVCDFNGCLRGKRVPVSKALSLADGVRMPLSVSAQDIWGRDVGSNPMVTGGDADALAVPTGRAPVRMDWLAAPTALVPMWMQSLDGEPSFADPRRELARVLGRYTARGLTPVVAMEFEFYLVAEGSMQEGEPGPVISPMTGRMVEAEGVLSLDDLDAFEGFIEDVHRTAEASDINLDAAISEGGAGQFEVNMLHSDDALKAADDALLFKRLVKGVALRHGFAASFMAKPFAGMAGSGLHVHFSCLDADGANIFDNGGDDGSTEMRHAVAGMLAAMPSSMLLFAPHLNSYRRFEQGSHAPTTTSWAYENRLAAVRIPAGPGYARRIEHRVSGADCNPYLLLAAVLGAGLDGIEAGREPPKPVTGNAYESGAPEVPQRWSAAIDGFGAAYLDPRFVELFRACKAQELDRFTAQVSPFEISTYLDAV
ncbi:glutamine synthetase family protein [Algicella marina]|uniref:Glutamine synthetase n=1 Tax=Algicella marina TaxID=2683284 RepID=A0A6P1T538_9RHOB|nr:glutamine synthetase family protein [Algicella marina]QHQ37137.1 glutamine synthetase [Algicella marina]